MHYYSFNIGDYKKKTDHLTDLEDLAYRRLIDLYYDDESPLENEPARLARRIRMPDKADIVSAILGEFFYLGEDGRWHKDRCDNEIASYKAMSEGGKKGAQRRWNSPPNAPPKQPPMPTMNQEPITNEERVSAHEPEKVKMSPLEAGVDFEGFWSIYPKQVGRTAAFNEYKLAREGGISHETIIDGVRKYLPIAAAAESDRFILNPANWLKEGRWADNHNPAKAAGAKPAGSKPTNYERALLAGIGGCAD